MTAAADIAFGAMFLLMGLPLTLVPYYVTRFDEVTDAIGSTRTSRDVEPTFQYVAGTRGIGVLLLVGAGYVFLTTLGPQGQLALGAGCTLFGLALLVGGRPVATLDARVNGLGRVAGDRPDAGAKPTGIAVLAVRLFGAAVCFVGALALAVAFSS